MVFILREIHLLPENITEITNLKLYTEYVLL